ncbi:hypothetical protein [Photobacterium damselae]|uniref:Uncharacterized protein n=1 Tax=Photobacterium damselae subsp. damselae TaxID=85581 RepID=A0A850R0T6_PHODD|nr:hypothetical protein [Photobacterium damselae]NVH51821.1 hypothetical protein [Photobacterium damselae subsp. damselae]NVO79711.1 hypothetical protein [Photobacterium damselae subsp. damselae]NVP01149.1 hypothetical protein [Photobacterium damselae subsp. damselae]TLS80038.1 hypothetical protein FD719_19590 [Photobacterium damselae subsp. damselae]TLS90632.1 hypothetical protein FD722_07905 [Photobacterium damselae subsp. damselae]
MLEILIGVRFYSALYVGMFAVPVFFAFIIISYGDEKRMIFIDEQLSKDKYSYKRLNFMSIGARFQGYCFSFPFIRKRIKSNSKAFTVFMIFCSVWFYSVVLLLLSNSIIDYLTA